MLTDTSHEEIHMLSVAAGPSAEPRPNSPTNTLRPPARRLTTPPATQQPSRAVGRLARFSAQSDGVPAIPTVAALVADVTGCSAVDMGGWLANLGHRLGATYGRPGGPSLSCSATACNVSLGQAIMVALIIDLLVSDAYVHGFSPGEGGRIAVSLNGLEAIFELTIEDSGRGAAQGRGEGPALARRLVRQLGGWFETPEVIAGKRYIITVPRHSTRQSS